MKTLVRIAPDTMLPGLMQQLDVLLGNTELVLVTRDEYGAYLCAEGQLYDKALLASLKMNVVEDQNIRRENKLYSYKDQMEEIALRKVQFRTLLIWGHLQLWSGSDPVLVI